MASTKYNEKLDNLIRSEIKELRVYQQKKILDLLIDKDSVNINDVNLYQDLINLIIVTQGVINEERIIVQDETLLYELSLKIFTRSRKLKNKKEIRKAAKKILNLDPENAKELLDLINNNNKKEMLEEKINFIINSAMGIDTEKEKTLIKS